MAEETKDEIRLKTEEVNELLAAVPKWIIRWGTTLVFMIMIAGISISYFIHYPDTLTGKTIVTTLNPPVTLVAKVNGKIALLSVKDQEPVKQNEVLMVVESSADYKQVLKISTLLDTFQSNLKLKRTLPEIISIEPVQLGELTTPFLQFLKSYNDYKLFSDLNPQEKEIAIINKELETYKELFEKYSVQEALSKQEFELVEKDFNRYILLFQNNTIAAKEFEDKNREYLTSKKAFENTKINNLNAKITLNNLEKNKLQLQMQEYQDMDKYDQNLSQSAQSLQSAIESWEKLYLVRSPVNGTVSLFSFWNINQNIHSGDDILSVIPNEKEEMIAKLELPVQNSGKLKTGQKVNIRLDNYPYEEFGVLKGFVKKISVVTKNNNYSVEVSLPDKLTTSYHTMLDYKEEMQGSAEIITEELSVLDRIFYQFRKLMK
jgi:multidrug resistance efflux pump